MTCADFEHIERSLVEHIERRRVVGVIDAAAATEMRALVSITLRAIERDTPEPRVHVASELLAARFMRDNARVRRVIDDVAKREDE